MGFLGDFFFFTFIYTNKTNTPLVNFFLATKKKIIVGEQKDIIRILCYFMLKRMDEKGDGTTRKPPPPCHTFDPKT